MRGETYTVSAKAYLIIAGVMLAVGAGFGGVFGFLGVLGILAMNLLADYIGYRLDNRGE